MKGDSRSFHFRRTQGQRAVVLTFVTAIRDTGWSQMRFDATRSFISLKQRHLPAPPVNVSQKADWQNVWKFIWGLIPSHSAVVAHLKYFIRDLGCGKVITQGITDLWQRQRPIFFLSEHQNTQYVIADLINWRDSIRRPFSFALKKRLKLGCQLFRAGPDRFSVRLQILSFITLGSQECSTKIAIHPCSLFQRKPEKAASKWQKPTSSVSPRAVTKWPMDSIRPLSRRHQRCSLRYV